MGHRLESKIRHVVQITQFVLLFVLFVLAIIRFTKITGRKSRVDIWLVIVELEALTDNVQRLRRFYSLKTNFVLNCIEEVFWIAAIAISIMGVRAQGGALVPYLSGVTIFLATLLLVLASTALVYSWIAWRRFKREGVHPHDDEERGGVTPMTTTRTTSTSEWNQK